MKIVLIVLFVLLFVYENDCWCPECEWASEREILMSFYKSTSSSGQWTKSENWLSSFSDHCLWYGIKCNENQQITRIELAKNQLKGSLPKNFEVLTKLEVVDLSQNQLEGTIPKGLSQLKFLKVMNLSFNEFEEFEEGFEFEENNQVVSLDFQQNKVSKVFQFKNLNTLLKLDFSENNVLELPTTLGTLFELEYLDLSSNPKLTLPFELSKLKKLKELRLSALELRDFPQQLLELNSLETLVLKDNRMTQVSEIGNLTNLRWLELQNNLLTKLPDSINQLKNLELIWFSYNQINSFNFSLPKLQTLFLSGTLVPFLDFTPFFETVQSLSLSCPIYPTSLLDSSITRLQWTNTEVGILVPSMPQTIERMELFKVGEMDWSLNENSRLPKMKAFYLVAPKRQEFPYWIANNLNLTEIEIENVFGRVPSELGQLSKLEKFQMTGSEVEGSLPLEWSQLSSLQELKLVNLPNVRGTIPKEWKELGNHLKELSISGTNVSGELPSELYEWNQIDSCVFGESELKNLSCKSKTLLGDKICNVPCSGETLTGVWISEDRTCKELQGIFVWTHAGIKINSNQWELVLSVGASCDMIVKMMLKGEIEVHSQVQMNEHEYSLNVTFNIQSRHILIYSEAISRIWEDNCGEVIPPGVDFDHTTGECKLGFSILYLKPIIACSQFQDTILVNFKTQSLKANVLSLVFDSCQFNDPLPTVTMRGGWECSMFSPNLDCTPICGDGLAIYHETCDDGNQKNKDGCSQNCQIEDGWKCEEMMMSVCQKDDESSKTQPIYWIFLALGVIIIVMGVVSVIIIRKRSQKSFWISERELHFHDLLGEGQFGQVYKGLWRETTTVAIKVLKSGVMDKTQLKEFEEEAQLYGSLPPHPNIVQFLGICFVNLTRTSSQDSSSVRIITEFLAGGDLVHWIRGLDLPKRQKTETDFQLLKGISAGMVHLHENKIVHRDLAARNILIQTTLNSRGISFYGDNMEAFEVIPKISDFGLSTSVKKGTLVAVRWAAPEILEQGPKASSTASDVWSFGILVFEILVCCKEKPYSQFSNQEVIQRVLSGNPLQPPPESNAQLSSLMVSCLTPSNLRPKFIEIIDTFKTRGGRLATHYAHDLREHVVFRQYNTNRETPEPIYRQPSEIQQETIQQESIQNEVTYQEFQVGDQIKISES